MTTRLVTQEVTKSPTRLAAGLPISLLLMPLQTNLRLLRGVGSATLTRSTIKTFVDKDDGLVKTAAIDVAAFEQNGILIEGASTNLFIRSEEFDNAAWSKVRADITANSTTSPDGTLTADTITSNDAAESYATETVTITSGETTTVSCYIKEDTADFAHLLAFDGSANGARAWFDISNGVIGTTTTFGTGWSVSNSEIEALTNGWFRCKAVFATTGTALRARINMSDSDGATASAIGKSIFIWGAQLEELPFASSYIKTVASTVTKTDEDTDIDAANVPAPTADYTISMEVDAIGFDSGLSQVLFNVAGETSRRIAWNTTTGAIEATHGAVTSVSTSTFVAGDRVKISFAVDAINQTLFINGIQEDQDAKGTVTGTATAVNIGHQAGVNQAFSHIKPLRIDDIALIAAQVGAL